MWLEFLVLDELDGTERILYIYSQRLLGEEKILRNLPGRFPFIIDALVLYIFW